LNYELQNTKSSDYEKEVTPYPHTSGIRIRTAMPDQDGQRQTLEDQRESQFELQ
jgi:hypothetical protein